MTTTRKVVIGFWIFIVISLLWEFYNYNQGLSQQAIDHPTQQHFYFLHTNAPPVTVAQVRDAPDIIQTSFTVTPDTPAKGSFTCNVTLKNVGTKPATGIQICVRPFRGANFNDPDVGGPRGGILDDDDPISMISDWLSFPDLGPGQSSTRTDVFLARPGIPTGVNPKAQIIFETAKTSPPPTPTTTETPAAPQPPTAPDSPRHAN